MMTAKIHFILLFSFFGLFFLCGKKTSKTYESADSLSYKRTELPQKLNIQWKFEENGQAEYGAPKTKVSIIINGKIILIEKEIEESCSEISRFEFSDRDIPEDALAAYLSWWAGAGTINYIQKSGNKLVIYRTYIAEETIEDETKWEIFREILASEL